VTVEVRVLGSVALVRDGEIVSLPEKQRRLLGALVVAAGEAVPDDRLVDAIWADAPPPSASGLLQVYVSQLRKALGKAAALERRGRGYSLQLSEGDHLDADLFQRLLADAQATLNAGSAAHAVALFDSGFALWHGPAYGDYAEEDFARAEAARLEEIRVQARQSWLEARLETGEDVAADALALVANHPLREGPHRVAMLALYRSGRQSEALALYRALRSRLTSELGLEPGPELRELQQRILQHHPILAAPPDPAAASVPLPAAPNALLGRQRELDELQHLLLHHEVRLLVLTGAGGSGKTRLALETARTLAPSFANGAVFVELAPIRDPALWPSAVARALALPEAPGEPPLDSLARALRPRELLLVLDNAEHLRAAASGFADLLAQAPRLTLLVTSRVVLHLSGEHVYPVQPLAEEPAVVLFQQRAREADDDFRPDTADKPTIRGICARLDGLPLAIELAAARTRVLSPADLLERLDRRLPLLTGGPHDLPARQRTLRATIEWSFDLLTPQEQNDFCRLSVFSGGWTLEGAEAVGGASMETLAGLVDHSLVRHERSSGRSRYTMLETLREFAHEQLATEESQRLIRRLSEFLVELGEAADAEAGAARDAAAVELFPELANFRTAIAWAIESDPELALRLAWLGPLFQLPIGEVRSWLEKAIEISGNEPTLSRARALHAAARFAGTAHEAELSQTLWNQALGLYQQLDNAPGVARAIAGLAFATWLAGEIERARSLYSQSLELYRDLGDRDGEWIVTNNLGELEREAENYELAGELLEAAIAIAEGAGDPEAAAQSIHGLGDLALAQGQTDRAEELQRKAISIVVSLPGGPRMHPGVLRELNLCWSLAALASIAATNGDVQRAGVLWGALEALEEQLATTLPQSFRDRYRHPINTLDREHLDAAIRHGRTLALALNDVIAFALA
jgi:predicted ATPase/DNA-binding SARP family transcriptional activator